MSERVVYFTDHYREGQPDRVTVDHWQEKADWSVKLVAQSPLVHIDGDILHVTVDNGWARYRITERHDGIISTRLIESCLRPEEGEHAILESSL